MIALQLTCFYWVVHYIGEWFWPFKLFTYPKQHSVNIKHQLKSKLEWPACTKSMKFRPTFFIRNDCNWKGYWVITWTFLFSREIKLWSGKDKICWRGSLRAGRVVVGIFPGEKRWATFWLVVCAGSLLPYPLVEKPLHRPTNKEKQHRQIPMD